jgi:ubiquinone/menaquinone biosynthesis C-methylase UbiE
MFNKSASVYDFMYAAVDYEGEAEKLRHRILDMNPQAQTLLDLGCGTGRHLASFARHFAAQGLDMDRGLLAVAEARCPGVRFHCMDMADFALQDRFDVVTCLFSAIGYVQTVDQMRRAVATMARHLNPGGLLIVEPWFEPERFWTDTITVNHADAPDMKICWMYTSKREGNVSVLDIHYLVGTPQHVEHVVEEHRVGLFTREESTQAMQDAGLTVTYDPQGPFNRGLYVGQAPPDGAA